MSDIATRSEAPVQAARLALLSESLADTGNAKLFSARKLFQANDFPAAKQRLEFLVANNPPSAEMSHMLGVGQYATGEHELALANVKLATEIEPETEVYKTELEVLEKAVKEAAEKAAADGTSE